MLVAIKTLKQNPIGIILVFNEQKPCNRIILTVHCNHTRRDLENELIEKFNARYLNSFKKRANDFSALRYAIIKLKSEKV